jgi:tmRNA-binding protein
MEMGDLESASDSVINFDMSTWSQEKKNMRTAMTISILSKSETPYEKIETTEAGVKIVGAEVAITDKQISDAYDAWVITRDAKIAENAAIAQSKKDELARNKFTSMKLADITEISVSDLTELVKYIKAKE